MACDGYLKTCSLLGRTKWFTLDICSDECLWETYRIQYFLSVIHISFFVALQWKIYSALTTCIQSTTINNEIVVIPFYKSPTNGFWKQGIIVGAMKPKDSLHLRCDIIWHLFCCAKLLFHFKKKTVVSKIKLHERICSGRLIGGVFENSLLDRR